MALPQVVDMGGPLFFPDGIIPRLYGRRHFRHLRHPDYWRGKAPDVVRRLAGIDDILRHFGLEGAFARERDDAVEIGPVDSGPFRQRADVQVVLAQRVLEAAFGPIDRLRPLGALLVIFALMAIICFQKRLHLKSGYPAFVAQTMDCSRPVPSQKH